MRKYPATAREAYTQRAIALRVAQEITVIRTTLYQHGYRIRKRHKQPVWKIFTPLNPSIAREEARSFYLLTYQPAPISSWVLYPTNNDAAYLKIVGIIQRALPQHSVAITTQVS